MRGAGGTVPQRAIGRSFARPECSKKTIPLCRAMSVGRQKQMHLRTQQWVTPLLALCMFAPGGNVL